MVALLAIGARPLGDVARFDARFHKRIWRIIAAAIAMGIMLWAFNAALSPFLGLAGIRYIALMALVLIGMGSFALFGQIFGAFKLSELRMALRGR